MATVFWGVYAVGFASFASGFGALIEAVNQVGSLFYGGCWACSCWRSSSSAWAATARSVGVLAGRSRHLRRRRFTHISFLWYNVIGCVVVIAVALAVPRRGSAGVGHS